MLAQPDTPRLLGIQISLPVTATNFIIKELAINNRCSPDLLSKELQKNGDYITHKQCRTHTVLIKPLLTFMETSDV